VGSFFTNPLLAAADAERLPMDAPRWPAGKLVKVSAAWLIERSGFPKGYVHGGVAISTKHTLALTNRGAGTTAELLALAEEIKAGVQAKFGVELHPEPVLVP
jgi:UDP-N-acetylmuramate dehydrogenase